MTHYKISKEELEAFAKKVYEEACYGYLDLKDSVCDGMIRDFLDGRKILPPIDTNIMSGPSPGPTGPVGIRPMLAWDTLWEAPKDYR